MSFTTRKGTTLGSQWLPVEQLRPNVIGWIDSSDFGDDCLAQTPWRFAGSSLVFGFCSAWNEESRAVFPTRDRGETMGVARTAAVLRAAACQDGKWGYQFCT